MSIIQFLNAHPAAFVTVAAILGLLVGSFLNVVIFRLPVMMEREWKSQCAELLESPPDEASEGTFNLMTPRSRCPKCGHGISAFENIPVLSYVFLGGKCAGCGTHISARYPSIEILSGVMSAVVAWHFGVGWEAAGALLVTWALIAASWIDIDHQLLPDSITLPFLWLGLGFNLFEVYTTTEASLIGAMAGYGILWSVYQLFKLATGKEGMGFGDFKLLAMLGAWLGWELLPVIILLSSVVGAIVGIGLMVLRSHGRDVPIPFGPYIAMAGWIALIWGHDITQAYLRFSGY